MTMELNFTKICRVCLEINSRMFSILESDIRKKLMACATVDVSKLFVNSEY